MSFRLKTILGIAAIELSVMLILITVNQLNFSGTAGAQLYDRARSTGDLFATMVADAVISTDLATLDAMVANTLSNDDLVYIRVRNSDGVVLSSGGDTAALASDFRADANFDASLSDHRADIGGSISVAGQAFGSVELGISTLRVEEEMATALRWNAIVAAIGMTLVAIFGYVLGSVLTRQLGSLREGASMIASGNLGYQITVCGRDELAETAECFNAMAKSLAAERDALEKKQSELLEKRTRTHRIVQAMTVIARGDVSETVPDSNRADEIGDMARATIVFQNAMDEIQRARAEQAQLISAFDQLDEQVAIFGQDKRSIFQNAAFRTANAAVLQELPGRFTYVEYLEEGLRQNVFPGAVGRAEAWLAERICTDGMVATEIAFAPDRTLLLQRNLVEGVGEIVSASDITELKFSQAQLVQASKLATLGEMSTGIAHELNQPLGVIRMAANNCLKRLQKGQTDVGYLTSKLQRVCNQTERAAQIIDHMRIFGRTDDGTRSCFDLAQSLENVERLMRRQLEVQGISLSLDIGRRDISVKGQQVMFEQVLLNLMSNARDAMVEQLPDGAKAVLEVELQTRRDAQASIQVRDTGGGIPEAILDRLFDPFFTTKEPGKGTGLGLSISYGIVRDMGGQLTAHNLTDGAQFEISLPVAQ